MRRRSSQRRPARPKPFANAKYDREQRWMRSGRMPITLIDASTRAGIATGLQTLAASFHATRPCYAEAVQRVAQQVTDSYTAAQAVTNYPTKPTTTTAVAEVTLSDRNLAEVTLSESTASDIGT